MLKNIYNLDGEKKASTWVREGLDRSQKTQAVPLSSGLKVKQGRPAMFLDTAVTGHIGYFLNNNNNVGKNAQSVAMFASTFFDGHGLPVTHPGDYPTVIREPIRIAEEMAVAGQIGYFYNHGNNVDQNALSVAMFASTYGNGNGLPVTHPGDYPTVIREPIRIPEEMAVQGQIGYFYNDSNNVDQNALSVAMFASTFFNGHGLPVVQSNLHKCCALFTARKSIKGNWINDKDEYLAPNEDHPKYEQFKYDSLVYTLFNGSSQQAAMRHTEYKNSYWTINNQFFWMDPSQFGDLRLIFPELALDLYENGGPRVISDVLMEDWEYFFLSPDAQWLMDEAESMVKDSMAVRRDFHLDHPEFQLNTWDAGFCQLKNLWKHCFPERFANFIKKYNDFEQRLIPLVHELGFLR